MSGAIDGLRARHITVLRQLMPDVDDDAFEALNYAIAALARQEAVACETCGGTGWVEFEGYGNSHHRKCPHCKHPAPPNAGEAEWPLFTWSGIAPRKLDALRSQGWAVNGYALYRDGMRGLIDLHGAVHWVGDSPTPTPQSGEAAYTVFDPIKWDAMLVLANGCELPLRKRDDGKLEIDPRYAKDGTAAPASPQGVSEDVVERALNAPLGLNTKVRDMLVHPGTPSVDGNKWKQAIIRAALTAAGAAPEGWPQGLKHNEVYELPCDDKGRDGGSWLRVVIAEDGDVWLAMQDWEDIKQEHSAPNPIPSLRCRTYFGGGRHGRTHAALLQLANAIRLDTAATPNPGAQHGQEGRDHG